MSVHSDDFTDQEAIAAILRITRGNIRLIERLMMQVEHILVANQLQVVTKPKPKFGTLRGKVKPIKESLLFAMSDDEADALIDGAKPGAGSFTKTGA